MIAANQDLVTADGSFDLGAGNGAPMVIPPDITSAINAAAGGAAAAAVSAVPSASAAAVPTSASAAPETSQSAAPTTNGAGSVVASSALVGLIAVVGNFGALLGGMAFGIAYWYMWMRKRPIVRSWPPTASISGYKPRR